MVIILNGIGVNPAVNTIKKLYKSNFCWIAVNNSEENPGMWLKKNIATAVYSPMLFHQEKCPIVYPIIAPKMLARLQTNAKYSAFDCMPKAKAIKRTSGGIGKNEDSDNDKINNAGTPYFVLDQCKTQLYNLLK